MTTKEHLTTHDKQIASIRVLMNQGMKMLAHNQEQIGKLIAAQQKTDKTLRDLLESLKSGRNGNAKH